MNSNMCALTLKNVKSLPQSYLRGFESQFQSSLIFRFEFAAIGLRFFGHSQILILLNKQILLLHLCEQVKSTSKLQHCVLSWE